MAQDSVDRIGAAADTLIVEFDQATYIDFFCAPARSKKLARSFKLIHAPSCNPDTNDACLIIQARAKASKDAPECQPLHAPQKI